MQHRPPARGPLALLATLCCAAALAACDAGPTLPTSFAQSVGGRTYVAVTPPDGLPDARTWLPFVTRAGSVLPRLKQLRADEAKARGLGSLERAASLAADQARLAAAAAADVGPEPLLRADAALERWQERAAARRAQGTYPALDSAAADVARLRTGARQAALKGDTSAAVAELTEAAERARGFAPQAVGLRLLADAERRLDAGGERTVGLRRARQLLRSAREALVTGDDSRAVRRAAYAIQILDAELPRDGARATR
jgi:hypothetical protein